MAEEILDGTGTGNRLKVGSDNRLQARAITELEEIHNSELGNSFNFNTGLISVTGDSTLIYFRNNSEENYILKSIALGSFEGITHSDDPYITVVKNPTGGDLITDETVVDINENRNFGSSKEADAFIYKGKVGGTLTGGSTAAILQASGGGRSFYGIDLLLPKGSSVAVNLTANVSSGSANWYCALIGYFKDDLDAQ